MSWTCSEEAFGLRKSLLRSSERALNVYRLDSGGTKNPLNLCPKLDSSPKSGAVIREKRNKRSWTMLLSDLANDWILSKLVSPSHTSLKVPRPPMEQGHGVISRCLLAVSVTHQDSKQTRAGAEQ